MALTVVETRRAETVNLFSGNAGVIVSPQQWSSSVVAKVTVRPEGGTPEDWYLQEDGSVAGPAAGAAPWAVDDG